MALLDRQLALPMLLRVLVHDTSNSMTCIQTQNGLSYCSFCIFGQRQGTSGLEHAERNHIARTFEQSGSFAAPPDVCLSRTGHPLSPLIRVRCAGAALSFAFTPVHFDGRLSLLYRDSSRRPLIAVSASLVGHLCP